MVQRKRFCHCGCSEQRIWYSSEIQRLRTGAEVEPGAGTGEGAGVGAGMGAVVGVLSVDSSDVQLVESTLLLMISFED
jgi:serine acetyltransferase